MILTMMIHARLCFQVSGVVGRADVLCCLFFLASFLTYIRYIYVGLPAVLVVFGSIDGWALEQRKLPRIYNHLQYYIPVGFVADPDWRIFCAHLSVQSEIAPVVKLNQT